MADPFAKVVCGFLKSVQQVAADNSAAAFNHQKEAVEELRGGIQKSKGALNWALPLLETMVQDMRRIVRCTRNSAIPQSRTPTTLHARTPARRRTPGAAAKRITRCASRACWLGNGPAVYELSVAAATDAKRPGRACAAVCRCAGLRR